MEWILGKDMKVTWSWLGGETGAELEAFHILTGLSVARVIGFESETLHRDSLIAELLEKVRRSFPPEDFLWEHLYMGPGKGSALRIVHVPSGRSIRGNLKNRPPGEVQRELLAQIFHKLRLASSGFLAEESGSPTE